ncbi:MAG: FtsX-like permease family protein, partial [Acidimicrobiia bacterium]
TARQGALPMALAGWEIARRPGRTARTSVLIVLSVTVGTFAAVHGASWQESLRDQADASVSSDVLVTPDPRPAAALPQELVPDAYIQLDGVDDVVPVAHSVAAVSGELSSVPVVLTATDELDGTLRLRSDLYGSVGSPAALASLHEPADLGAVEVGDADGDLVVDYSLIATPGTARGSVRFSATVLDRHGTPVYLDGDRVPVSDTGAEPTNGSVRFALRSDEVPGLSLGLDGPLRLVSLDVAFPAVQDVPFTDDPLPTATYRLTLGPARVGEREVALDAEWRIGGETLGDVLEEPSNALSSTGGSIFLGVDSGSTIRASASYTLTLDTGAFGDGVGTEIPVVVTPGLLDATSLAVGDRLVARIGGATADLRIDGVIPVVPFDVGAEVALLADWETVSVDRFDRTRRFGVPDAWAVSTDEATARGLERVLAGPPYDAAAFVERRQEARTISREPVTVGLSGSLALALAASLVVAAIGLILTAVVGGRERRPAFAVLRAMGTRASELRRWLVLETVPLVGFSAAAGIVAGIALARLALPSLGVSREGTPSIPSPRLVVPWPTLAVVVAIAVAAGMALPVVTARLLRRHRTADELRIGDTS